MFTTHLKILDQVGNRIIIVLFILSLLHARQCRVQTPTLGELTQLLAQSLNIFTSQLLDDTWKKILDAFCLCGTADDVCLGLDRRLHCVMDRMER